VIAIFSHTVGVLDPEVNVITAFGLTVIVLVAFVVPHDPPEVVNVNVIGVVDPADAVYVAVLGVAPPLFVNEPLAPSVHTAEVAPPPNEPPNAAEVPPWQIAPITPPTLTVGFGLTTIVLVAFVVPHDPPEVVNVNVIGVVDPAEAVYVAVLGVAPPLFVNEPLAPSVHTAEVAPPPNDPPNAAEVPPWQIAPITPPTLTVGFGLTVIVPVAVVCVHVPVVVTV